MLLPLEVHGKPASGPQACGGSGRPLGRQRRQQLNIVQMALHQHLGNACRSAEVAVNLEGRMVIEQIGQGGFFEQLLGMGISLLPIQQPGPEVDDPCPAPAGMASPVGQAVLQGHPGGLRQFRGLPRADGGARMQGEQMGDVAVAGIHFLIVHQPLLELAVLADFHSRQPGADGLPFFTQVPVRTQDPGGFHTGIQQLRNNLGIHGRPVTKGPRFTVGQSVAVFRGNGRSRHQETLRTFHQKIGKEQGRFLHKRISPFKGCFIGIKAVMLPGMEGQPCAAHDPLGGRTVNILGSRIRPDVRIMMRHKTAAAVHGLCGNTPLMDHPLDQIEQGLVAFRQVAGFGRPIVHLGVDVNGEFAIPGGRHGLIPDALEIGG
ncbi:hypothetical protein D3C75_627270 [compost metagenome]